MLLTRPVQGLSGILLAATIAAQNFDPPVAPDKNPDPRAKTLFQKYANAYEVRARPQLAPRQLSCGGLS